MTGTDQHLPQAYNSYGTHYDRPTAKDVWRARALGRIEYGRLGDLFLGRKPLPTTYKIAPSSPC